ncbi:hypothetical protein NM688_g996 [Phlebia brevispora]|uniref:Uncharacterized protein n=1 Tax=Phlebia brevispora TaxID=194682 RepID=A0ACC1TCF1_9APHY|nr:hypothetical protein NM688_g996 [Phlebia brevispora]
MADAVAPLSPDIQRALQEAIGNVNDAAHLPAKKKKKRSRDAESTEHSQPVDEQVKKRKKKKHHAEQVNASLDISELVSPEAVVPSETVSRDSEKKKKKTKKSKGKSRARDLTPTDQVEGPPQAQEVIVDHDAQPSHVDDDIAASSADFLSAVVAAASATSHMQDGPPDFQQPGSAFTPFPEQFTSYPPVEYPYASPLQPPFGPSSHPPPMFGDLDLSLTSSEDLLRTLQDLDITKIASVLKTLGEASVAANGLSVNIPPSFIAPPPLPGPPPVHQVAAKSDAILGRPPKQVKESGQSTRTLNTPRARVLIPTSADEGNQEHAHMLANVWMNASKLSQLAKEQGLVYKRGKFSAVEEAQLETAIENYRLSKGLTQDDMVNLIFTRDKGRDAFWVEITSALHLRPIISVYHHVRRVWHPMRGQGKWMPCEDAALKEAILKFGQQWEKVSEFVGRSGPDCRDRYRNHIEEKGIRNTGVWTKEEEEELTRIVTELTVQQGKDTDNDIFWGVVSKRMSGRRGKQQCRIKWLDTLSGKFKNEGRTVRWSQLDAYILVHKIDSLNVHDDTEIDWKKLPDEHWNVWSPHSLQRRWLCMKRSIKGYEDMSHAGKHALPLELVSPPPSRPHKKITSAEMITDSDEESTPGSSTGPGTTTHDANANS